MKQKNSALVITFFSIIILGCTTTKKVSSDKTEKSSKNNIVQNLIREGKTEEVKKYFEYETKINELLSSLSEEICSTVSKYSKKGGSCSWI